MWKLCECIIVKMKSWIAESDFSFRDARVPQGNPSTRLQAYSRGKPKRQCCNSAIETEDYHRVNTFFTSLNKILAEIENPFRGNDRDVFCFVSFFWRLVIFTLSYSPTSHSFDLSRLGTMILTRSHSKQTKACSVNSRQKM